MYEVLEMTGYERMIKVMRVNAKKALPLDIEIATMTSGTACTKGELNLERDDLLIAEHLLTGYLAPDESVISPLKKGDKVIIKRISGEKYVIIERVI